MAGDNEVDRLRQLAWAKIRYRRHARLVLDVPQRHYDLAMQHLEHLANCTMVAGEAAYVYEVVDCVLPDPLPEGWVQLGNPDVLYTVHAQCGFCGASNVLEVSKEAS